MRSDTQGRIFAELFVRPEEERTIAQIARSAQTSVQTVIREINLAEQAGLVATRRLGNVRLVKVVEDHPLYAAYSQIVLATYGPPAVIREIFSSIDGVATVILFGSWAARYDGRHGRFPNDIDVLVIGEPNRNAVHDAEERAEQRLGIPVQATIRTVSQWHATSDPFIADIHKKPHLVVSEADSK